jgi:hypothetical protein
MSSITTPRTRAAAAITAAGLAIGVPITAISASADPVGPGYAPANRVLTVVWVALLVWMLGEAAMTRAAGAPRLARALVAGAAMLLLGNLIEFWVGLLQGRPVSAIATPRHEAAWVGSSIGYPVFFLGSVVLLVALAGAARARRRSGALGLGGALARPAFPIALTVAMVLWSSSVGAALVAGLICAGLVLAAATDGAGAPAAVPAG